ncbi:hypothetical protein N8I77_013090 [Diaporthe amygdali]|uniref:Rhodopsin domain-containing protein n=1 Tax=Phomopsis amygdali TaxID=1214568 RepID=A0AAD9VX25_PHOAM|nr:hypothetical protein N8I77_013090 [Diaporthe amygdali]
MWDYGDDNRGPEMAAVALVMTSLSVIAVALRCYTMVAILKRFLIEDWLAVLTCLLQCAFCAFVILGVSHGLGAHVEHVPEDQRPKALIFKWAGQIAYIVVSTMVKFVVGIFLLRLCVNNGWQRITIWVLLILVGLFNAFYVFVAVFQCQPVPFYWWRYATDAPITGTCNGKKMATIPTYIAVLLGIAGDLILALLPITLIKHAKLDKKTKISVICVLSLGSLASVATIARIPYAQQLLSNPDYLYNFADLAIWSIVECGIAITASSLATLRPLFVKMKLLATNHFTSRFTSSMGGSGGLPRFTNKTNTFVSSSQMQNQDANRYPTVTETTAMNKGAGLLKSAPETRDGGIQVRKEFEMSVITRSSKDSIDQLEDEVNEVIRPGASARSSTHSRGQSFHQSLRPSPSPRLSPAPSGPSLQDAPMLTAKASTGPPPTHATNGHFIYTDQYSSGSPQSSRSHEAIRKGSFGQVSTPFGGSPAVHTDVSLRSPPPIMTQSPRHGHQSTSSQDSFRSPRTPRSTAPSFHLPTRVQHYSMASSASGHSRSSTSTKGNNSRGTFGADGLPPPSRITESGYGEYSPGLNSNPSSLPGSPEVHSTSRSLGDSPITTLSNSNTTARFPFERPEPILEVKKTKRRTRVSAFLADNSSVSSVDTGDCSDEELTKPQWTGHGREAPPSPLTSHPPLSPRENWV